MIETIKTYVSVLKGNKKGIVGYVIGDFEARKLSPLTKMLVHFTASYPNDARQYLASDLREATEIERMLKF